MDVNVPASRPIWTQPPVDLHVMLRTVINRRVLLLKIAMMDQHAHSEHHRPSDAPMVAMLYGPENLECTRHPFKSQEMIRQNFRKPRHNNSLDMAKEDNNNSLDTGKTDNSNSLDTGKTDNSNSLDTAKEDNSNKLDMAKTDNNNSLDTAKTDNKTEEISTIIHNRRVSHNLVNRRNLVAHVPRNRVTTPSSDPSQQGYGQDPSQQGYGQDQSQQQQPNGQDQSHQQQPNGQDQWQPGQPYDPSQQQPEHAIIHVRHLFISHSFLRVRLFK